MIETIKENEKKKEKMITENFQQLKEETNDKTTEETELMITEMNSKKMTIYNALESLFKKFMYDSKEKFQKYTQLMDINSKSTKQIEENIKRIKKIKNKIKLITLKIL